MNDLPPDLPRLRTLETWLEFTLGRAWQQIADLERREVEQRHGQEQRPPAPDWLLEIGLNRDAPPNAVHVGGCHMAGKRTRGITRSDALH
ncbi:DUF6233 domain-containing protein [Streptomyces sp. V3I7]|uniref:DUF6233 domain-containing protein n=1 Tax=Streptomyces sp. V3I7 TaxID=3042278 RepID=UPI002789E970|nr:DUF6233 domain-containing protein [Streptomyces sp. V3I7]MDQ0994732.1 hypothetical protein [Streptomyces sp. V3I7]